MSLPLKGLDFFMNCIQIMAGKQKAESEGEEDEPVITKPKEKRTPSKVKKAADNEGKPFEC